MKRIFTLKSSIFLKLFILSIAIGLLLFTASAYAQVRQYATIVSGNAHVDNVSNAALSDDTFARVKSSGVLIAPYRGEIELSFANDVPANRTAFVRINVETALLDVLLGGNLGSALSKLLGGLLLGNHSFSVTAVNASGEVVASGVSSDSFNSSEVKLIRDATGSYYLAITPTRAYKTIKVRDITSVALLGGFNHIDVYNAFYVPNASDCDVAFGTDYEGTGATLSLVGLGNAGVSNIHQAIDGNPSTASKMNLGLITLAGTISQNIYFTAPSKVGDEFNIRLKVAPDLLNLGLLSNLRVEAFKGNTQVYTAGNVSSLLTLDLLGLLNGGNSVNIPFSPNAEFDRVKITLASLLNVAVAQSIDIYEVTRSAPRPRFDAPTSNALFVCYGASAYLKATSAETTELLWYDSLEGGNLLGTAAYNASYNTGPLTASKTFYVAARSIGCTSESIRVPVVVTVNPQIVFPNTALSNGTVGLGYNKQLTSATGGVGPYTYSVAAPNTLPNGVAISASGLISGIPTQSGTYNFTVNVTDSKDCSVSQDKTIIIYDKIILATQSLPDGIVGTVYPDQVIPAATGGSGGYTYAAANLPPGLSFDPATRTISGTPINIGTYNVDVTVTDSQGNSVNASYPIRVKDPFILSLAPLVDGIVGKVYQTQTIPPAQGGLTPYTYTATNLPQGLVFDIDTRQITGTPTTAGTFIITVTATDGSGTIVDADYTIRVIEPLLLPAKILTEGTLGVLYTGETLPIATGGVGPYTYVVENVPEEIVFNASDNTLVGTPINAGTYSIALTVTDSEGRTATNYYTLKVNGALSLAGQALNDGMLNVPFATQTLPEVSGGAVPYTYQLTGLPAGLTFNSTTREISGTPTVAGNFTLTMNVTDNAGNAVNANYQLRVGMRDPQVSSVIICAGSTATMSVTNTEANVTYNWYAAQGNTPIATNNNGQFISGPINASTSFYVEAVSGSARSNRVQVTVTANNLVSAPTIITNNPSVNINQSTTIRAIGEANTVINWYSQATGGTALASGEEFTTPALTANTTYYAEALSAAGCATSGRTSVTVTVVTNPDACNIANAQSSGINSLLCVLCNVSNPTYAVDSDRNNFTRITLAVGVAATGFQRLIFPSAGLATDSISLDLATPVGLADVTLLSGITVNVMRNNTIVRTLQLNSSLVNLQLLSGNRFKANFAAGANFDRVEIRFQALVSAVTSLDIYGAKIVYPRPTIAAQNQTICYNTSATINATANGGTTLSWYDAPTGGNLLPIVAPYTTPNLTATTTYYVEVSRDGCASSERIPVTINVVPLLEAPTVVSSNVTACASAAAVLAVSNPIAGVTYRWYDAATDGNLLSTGANYNATNITSNRIFYVEAFQTDCVSATRTAVAVTVAPRPAAPQLQGSVTSIRAGQTAVLTATSTDSDVDFNWYSSRTSSAPLYSGDTFVTPPLSTTTSYYVEAVSRTTNCASASRIMVTVNVDPTVIPSPVPCEAPVAEESGLSGIALLAGVSNSSLAIDNNTETASTLFLPVGALNASVYQRLIFAEPSRLGDTLRVLLSAPGKLLSLGVLSSVQISTLNGNTSNNDVLQLDNSLIQLELLSGGNQALVTFVPTSVFDKVEVRLNGGVLTALSSINLNYARKIVVAPTVTSNDVSVCVNTAATLEVSNVDPNYTYNWYDKDGVYLASGTTYNTSNIAAATHFYVTTVSQSGCESARTVVKVNVNPAPQTPILVANNISTCSGGNVVIEIKDPVAGVTYQWYQSGAPIHVGDKLTLTNVLANAVYEVETISTACGTVSSRTTANITIGTLSAPILTENPVSISPNTAAVLHATSSTSGVVFRWYENIGDAQPFYTGPIFVTPLLTADKTYYVDAYLDGACASSRVAVHVEVITDGNPGTVPCNTASINVDSGVENIALLSGVFNPGLAVDDKVETGSTLAVTVGLLGGYAYQRVGFVGQSKIGDTVRVHISSPAKLLSLGVLSSVDVSTYNGSTSNSDEISVSNPLISIELLSDGSAGTLTFVPTKVFDAVEIKLRSGVASVLTSLNLNYVERLIKRPEVVQAAVSVCVGNSATLSVKNALPGVVYNWYLGNDFQGAGQNFATSTNLAVGTHNFYVRAFANGCESVAEKVVVTILPAPAKPVALAANPSTTCQGTSAVIGVVVEPGLTYNWYNATGDLLVQNNDTYTVPNNLPAGVYTYTVKAINATNCVSSDGAEITITIQRTAINSDIQITGNTKICGGTATLTASSTIVTNPEFKWYSDAALTVLEYTGAVFSINGLTANKTYYVTVSGDGVCANLPADAKLVEIEVNPFAVAADLTVSPTQEICGETSVVLTATSTTVTNPIFTWYSDAALTTPVGNGASFTTTLLSANTTYYVTVKGDDKCENLPATARSVSIIYRSNAVMADVLVAGPTKTCNGNGVTLTASSTTVINPIFTWYADANLTNILYVGATYVTPVLTQDVTYFVTVKGDNKCESRVGEARPHTVVVNDYALAADVTVTGTVDLCGPGTTTLTASSTTVTNPVFTWYSDAGLTTVAYVGSVFTTPLLAASQTYYVTVKGDNKCENKVGTARNMAIVIKPYATRTDLSAVTPINLCGSGVVTLTANTTTVVNPIFSWYSDAALTTLLGTGSTFQTPTLSVSTKYYVTVKGDNRCENLPAEAVVVDVIYKPIAVEADIALNGVLTICSNGSTTITATSTTVSNPIFTWYSDATLTTKVYTGGAYTPTLANTTTFYVTVKGDEKCENVASSVASVTVQVFSIPDAPTVSATGTNVCVNNATTLTVTSPQADLVYEWFGSATGGTSLGTGSSYATAALGSSVTYWVQAIGTAGCTTPSPRTRVDVTVNSVPSAPAVEAANTSVCINSAAVLRIANPVAGLTYRWYTSASGGIVLFTGDTYTTDPISANVVFYAEAASGDCISTSRTAVNVSVVAIPSAPSSVKASNNQLCAGTGTVLTVNNPETDVLYRWYTVATGGTSLYEGNVFTTPALSQTTTYYVEAAAAGGNCVSPTRTGITVNTSPVLQTPTVFVGAVTHESIEFTWSAITGATDYEYSIDGGTIWTATTATSYTATNLARAESVTIIVRARGVLACQTSANSTAITGTTTEPFKDSLYVPNTFTPNGDGNNDVFYGYGNNVNTYKMRIFNQWGKLIFESQNVLVGWDGSSKGEMQPTGVYVYAIDVVYGSGAKKSYRGTVTLIR